MAFTQTIPYTTSTNYTFDSSLVEFVADQAQLKKIVPANSVMYNNFTTTNLTWSNVGGSLTGTLNGSPVITAGKLVCAGSQGVYYTGTSAAQETMRVLYTPNYTGNPPANINIIGISNPSNNNDRFLLSHSPSGGTLRITANTNTGGVVAATIAIGAAPGFTAGVEYEIEVHVNSSTDGGKIRLFINGVLHGTLSLGLWSRGGISSRYSVGASTKLYNRAEGSFDNFIVYSDIQHTTTYTPGQAIPQTLYSITNPTVKTNATVTTDGISAFTETSTKTGSDEIKYTIIQNSIHKYWTGSAWATSDATYAQSSTASDINTNSSTLSFTDGQVVQLNAFLHSDTGGTTPQLDENTLDYDFFQAAPSAIPETPVYIYMADILGNPVFTDASFRALAPSSFEHGTRVIAKGVIASTTFTASGYAELSLLETASIGQEINFEILYNNSDGIQQKITFEPAIIPNDPTNGASLTVISEPIKG